MIITGAGGAIGGATAEVLAEAGANVVLSDLNFDAAQAKADEITQATKQATLALKTDVTDESQLQELVDATLNKFGKITALVNNVGWGEYTPLWGVSTDYMLKSYMLNTVSSYNLTKLCMPHLKKRAQRLRHLLRLNGWGDAFTGIHLLQQCQGRPGQHGAQYRRHEWAGSALQHYRHRFGG